MLKKPKRFKPAKISAVSILPTSDYLKYYRIVNYYIKAKYELEQRELDVMLFLYSEKTFIKSKFNFYKTTLGFRTTMFDDLLEKEIIVLFQKKGYGVRTDQYTLGIKARRIVKELYDIIEYKKQIPMTNTNNPLFKNNRDKTFAQKVYRNQIIQMAEYVKAVKGNQYRPSIPKRLLHPPL